MTEPHIYTPAQDGTPVILGSDQYEAFLKMLEAKPAPNEKLKKLMKAKVTLFPLMTEPANDATERNRLAEVRLLLQRTLEWLRRK